MTAPQRFRPVEHDPELPLERRHTCFCGHSFQQTLLEVDGVTDLGVVIDRQKIYAPTHCPSCSRAKLRAEASQ